MKPGARTLGVSVSAPSGADESAETADGSGADAAVAGALVRADRVLDGLSFSRCTVGGTDATAAVVDCFERLGREDVQFVLVAGAAPAWFNVVDLAAVHEAVDRPVLSVSFEASAGLAPALREHFSGDALRRRLGVYEALPPRVRVSVDDDVDGGDEGSAALWVRAVGCGDDEARRVVAELTPAGQRRPEPLRVARLAARGGRDLLG
ncbi:DUF99 family protein [Halobaculum sp. P14]|uniref:endonuclease dU n=1 Tax=Halobaculum sp. P14 TaxID=3421638 RepID=UPI003EBB230F